MAQTNQPTLTQEIPLWSAGHKQIGYSVTWYHDFRIKVDDEVVKIQFMDTEHLSLAWLVPDEPSKRSERYPIDVSSHLHLSILDAKTGQQVTHHEWPCTSLRVKLAYTANGQWLLSNDESITLYSSSFEKVRELQHVSTQSSQAFVSPSGRTLLSTISNSNHVWSQRLLNSTTFEVIDSWEVISTWKDSRRAQANFTYSDRFVLAEVPNPQQLFVREVGKSWVPFGPQGQAPQPARARTHGFLNDDTLVTFLGDEMIVKNITGTELFRQTVPEAGLFFYSWSTSATSAGGERFAVILDRMRGINNPNLDLYSFPANDRVVVYSVPQKGAIFSVKLIGSSPWFSHYLWNSVALSPDGLLLGIVSSEGVRVYALPDIQPRP